MLIWYYDCNKGSPSLQEGYVDGVSNTHGSNPCQHNWTYISGERETGKTQYTCNNDSTETTPQYVGDDCYCESGFPASEPYTFHYNHLLWDGKQSDYLELSCCRSPYMPWFIKSFNQSTTDYIELRICNSEGYPEESISVDVLELHVC